MLLATSAKQSRGWSSEGLNDLHRSSGCRSGPGVLSILLADINGRLAEGLGARGEMRRRFVQINGELVEVGVDYVPEPRDGHYVIPDISPFKSNDGAEIKGRAHWREHLKANGQVEMGHSDIKSLQAAHAKKKAAHQERLSKAMQAVKVASDVPVTEMRVDRPRIAVEVANRLHGRPEPDRKTLIRIALEERRRMR